MQSRCRERHAECREWFVKEEERLNKVSDKNKVHLALLNFGSLVKLNGKDTAQT